MTNKIILDAWNICWKIPEIAALIPENLEMARNKFQSMLKQHFYGKNISYKIFYDGQPGIYNSSFDIKKNITFSKKPESADSLILKFLKKQDQTSAWTLVSSDRQLAFHAKGYGAIVMTAENFIRSLRKSKTKKIKPGYDEPNLSEEEIEYWKKIFNDE